MAWENTSLTDMHGMIGAMKGGYLSSYGANISAFLKPFGTHIYTVGVPHYQQSLYSSGSIGSGNIFIGADSSGLNPFGPHTINEGILSGSGNTNDLETSIDRGFVRTLGLKAPANMVGWGYDQFGYPAPNINQSWSSSGTYSSTPPNSQFASSGFVGVNYGYQVPYSMWMAGPVDLRWDVNRKIWSPPQSVYSAKILQAYATGSPVSSGTPVYPSQLTYDAEIFDGLANRIRVTGLYHLGPQPERQDADQTLSVYKKFPLASGSQVLIVHTLTNGVPAYGIYAWEEPKTLDCAETEQLQSLFAQPIGNMSYGTLISEPLGTEYGGTSFGSFAAYDILVGHIGGSGNLMKLNLTAGTGIEISYSTGTVNIHIASGIEFTVGSGINNSITELQGLTTPLSINQGGTGSNTKNWLDFGSAQSASGVKNFLTGIRISSGSMSSPTLSFAANSQHGLYLLSNLDGYGFSTSGISNLRLTYSSGSFFDAALDIKPISLPFGTSGNINYASLIVQQSINSSFSENPLQIWRSINGTNLGYFNYDGSITSRAIVINASGFSTSGTLININSPSGFIGDPIVSKTAQNSVYFKVDSSGSLYLGESGRQSIITSPSGDRTINLASGYTGTVNVLASGISSVVTRQLQFIHGIFVGYTDI